MTKTEIQKSIQENYQAFVNYLSSLTDAEYNYQAGEKWTAAKQLEHMVLCMKPIVQVMSMDKAGIAQMFGNVGRTSSSDTDLLTNYNDKLNAGGKAPERFVPRPESMGSKEMLCSKLMELVVALNTKLNEFSEEELDTLCMPHPLMGSITVREMLYNTIHHVQHHQEQTKLNLVN